MKLRSDCPGKSSCSAPGDGLQAGRHYLRLAFLIAALALGVWGALHHPRYREWRLAHQSLAQLERERGAATGDYRQLYYMGLRLNEQGRYAEALPLLDQSAGLCQEEARIRDALAQAQVALGQTSNAFSQLRQFVGVYPNSADGHLALGRFYLAMKAERRAMEELEWAVTLDPTLAEGWAALAAARRDFSNDKATAIAAARQAVRLRPDNAEDQLRLAALLGEQSTLEASAVFERALFLAPQRADIRQRYADYLLERGGETNRARAETEARRAVALNDCDPFALRAFGRALTRRGADVEAADTFRRAATLDSRDVVAPRELARLCRRLGCADEADTWRRIYLERQVYLQERQRYWEAATTKPDASHWLRLAKFLGRHGDVVEALRYQGQAQKRVQGSPSVQIAVARDLIAGGHRAEAAPLLRRAAEAAVLSGSDTEADAARRLLTEIENRRTSP